ncbi:MAG: class C sortase [Firmicutes bacterium]|nr:class C sortase [Bacillota bacterium]
MKRKITNGLFVLLFLVGFGILVYPTVSDQWNRYRQSKLITSYEEAMGNFQEEDFSAEWEKARRFNNALVYNSLYSDVFVEEETKIEETEYWKVLNLTQDGVMGYLTIPKINVKLAIYHGVAEDILQTGIGHIKGSKLPIGEETNHSVLAAHRGLPSAKLFTDIDQLVKGDMFYIHIMDQTFAYQVTKVYDMIDKDDADTLGEALALREGKDLVTLFTCTPYGVNSHRLLVQGSRVEYVAEEEVESVSIPEAMLESVQNYYMIYLILGLSVTILIIVIMKVILSRQKNKEKKKE